MTKRKASKPKAVLNLSRNPKDVLVFARHVVVCMTDNPYFTSPNPPLTVLQTDIDALEASEAAVLTRAKGTAEARDADLATLKSHLEYERAYVQKVADADPANAEDIIASSGMSKKSVGSRTKGELGARQGSVSGLVELLAKSAGDRAAYSWQYGTDGETWTNLPPTMQASTTVSGLTPGVRYFFRVRVLAVAGLGDWSDVVSLIVT
jgi:fibronectin type III domain protein